MLSPRPPLLTSLKQAGLFVSVINPLVMKKYASAALRKEITRILCNHVFKVLFNTISYRCISKNIDLHVAKSYNLFCGFMPLAT
ncbi:hypothetical protein DRA42_06450 [Ethanoligenens harbinense]|nr:hypothetical protein CXQ68_06425 [Ethanoligenens harbinense YUAN-3]AYF38563.1 hypothetical protein CXP51_06295 [Ethanoligenens harbinense]AYF41310.1 hypothetical protein CN246_06435 [Ethanoligenens harbinense]QCN92142.1 hypothetical protein DRA42_06450 [Ethanoligenens harbinense]